LIEDCFSQFFRILKPNRWITVEFHNSKSEIWKIIQKAIIDAGFVVSYVAVLNKVQGTIHQDSNLDSAVKHDLIINAYKPKESFSRNFLNSAGVNMELDFIEMHLNKLAIMDLEHRTQHILYDRLVSYYFEKEFEVRMDSSEFYNLLRMHFEERDGFWFNHNQVFEYEKEKKTFISSEKDSTSQQILGIMNEKQLIIWLSDFLKTPKTFDEIFTEYTLKVMTVTDLIPELKDILEENFVKEDNKYRLPSDLEKKEKEEMRNKHLNKEFELILNQLKNNNKIVEVRKEALFYGLMKLYREKNIPLIKLLNKKIDKKIIESDENISYIMDWAEYK